MAENSDGRDAILHGIHVIDGGLASELEYLGAKIDGPLWSAHVLEDDPAKVAAVHRAYIEAGAQCIATCSYQVSRMGYAEIGLGAERADAALLHSVELARSVAAEFPERRVLVAGSLGPYGAALHNGAEYHGNYDIGFSDLVRFHQERIAVMAGATGAQRPDLLAFETLPSLEEAMAIAEALHPWPEVSAWYSFTCRDGERVAHGRRIADCGMLLSMFPQTAAIGVNCTQPSLVLPLIAQLRGASSKPIIVYPNSGERWDAERRCWTGTTDPEEFGARAAEWFRAGAQIVGGCCRTRPAHIRAVAKAAEQIVGN